MLAMWVLADQARNARHVIDQRDVELRFQFRQGPEVTRPVFNVTRRVLSVEKDKTLRHVALAITWPAIRERHKLRGRIELILAMRCMGAVRI